MSKEFYKITYQDIDIALEFFDYNKKDFSEFILATIDYYRGNEPQFKSKLVEKYFRTYKKTMDFIIQAKEKGIKGAQKRIENQSIKSDTLEGLFKGTSNIPLDALDTNNKEEIINNKKEKDNNKKSIEKIPTFYEFFDLFLVNKYIELNLPAEKYRSGWKLKYDSWIVNDWKDGYNKEIKNWKSKALNSFKFVEPKEEKTTYYEMPL